MITETISTLVAIAAPLVAVPLTLITFYLRTIREHQLDSHAQLERRIEQTQQQGADLRRNLDEVHRDYTTKEEWLRECLHTRQTLEKLTDVTARLDATLQTWLHDTKEN